MRKKFFAVWSVCLFLGLAACGDATAQREPEEPKITQAITLSPTTAPFDAEVPMPTVTAPPTATPTPTVVSTYQKGNLTETGFESEWLNMRFVAPLDVAMTTREELDVIMGISADLIYKDSSNYVRMLSKLTLVYEMMARHISGVTVAVCVELLPNSAYDMTEEQYLETARDSVRNVDVGALFSEEFHTRVLAGEEYTGYYSSMDLGNGNEVYQENLVRKKENRMIVVSLSYPLDQQETGEYLLSLFSEYDAGTPLPTAVPSEDTYQKGVMTQNSFDSEWLDISFRLPENMTMATQEEMDELMRNAAGLVYGEHAMEVYDYTKLQNVYEMQAMGETYGLPGIQIMVEKPGVRGISETEYADVLRRNLTQYNIPGTKYYVYDDLYSAEIAGRQYVMLRTEVVYENGAVMYQDYCIRKKEERIICIIVSYIHGMEDELNKLENALRPYGQEVYEALQLEQLREDAGRSNSLCAAAYLAYLPEGGYTEFMNFAEDCGIMNRIPFLKEISEENTVQASGGEWYLLVPADKTVRLTVNECVLDEIDFTLAAGRELLALEAGEPVLLQGNVSDIYPSFMVIITGADGREIHYAPGLSLRDGSLIVEEGIYDFTAYDKGQWEE